VVPAALFLLVFVQMTLLVFLSASAPAGIVPPDLLTLDRIFFTLEKGPYTS
jgi:hypothetical protein